MINNKIKQNKEMVVHLYANCWNERKILPFVVDYWSKWVTKAFVYDNGSTDGSVEFLQQFDWIEVRELVSEGFDDITIAEMKNTAWVDNIDGVDYIVCCDIDECIWHPSMEKVLERFKRDRVGYARPQWLEMTSLEFPEYKEGKLLHEQCPLCTKINDPIFQKACVFDPHIVENMNYGVGSHYCHPTFHHPERGCCIDDMSLYLLHCKQLNVDYILNRYDALKQRLSERNKKYNWGCHYMSDKTIIESNFYAFHQKAIDIKNYIVDHEK